MARSKQVEDEAILAAAMQCVITHGPSMTLADVGDAVGLSAATVVQRFGTKREMMRQVLLFRRARASRIGYEGEGAPVERLIRGLSEQTSWMTTPDHVANMTAVRQMDLADPEFRELIDAGFRGDRDVIAAVLQEGIDAGQLKPCDTEVIARLMQLTVLGAQQSWTIEPDGTLRDWITECLRTCIAPWLAAEEEAITPA